MSLFLCSEVTGPEAIEDALPADPALVDWQALGEQRWREELGCPCCGSDTCHAMQPPLPLPLREEAGTLAVEVRPDVPGIGAAEWEGFALFVTRYSDGAEWWEAENERGELVLESETRPDAESILDALVMDAAPAVLPQELP